MQLARYCDQLLRKSSKGVGEGVEDKLQDAVSDRGCGYGWNQGIEDAVSARGCGCGCDQGMEDAVSDRGRGWDQGMEEVMGVWLWVEQGHGGLEVWLWVGVVTG